jgi:hypothetical protein
VGPALEGYPVGWFAPSYKYLSEAWRDFIRILRPVIASDNFTEKRIELITGGVIDFWSLDDPDAGRSRKYKRVTIDEAAKVKNLEQCWNAGIRPTLTDFRGDADMYSTPKGHDFFWRCYSRGEDPTDRDWACWTMPTAANPFIDPAEIEDAKRQLPDRVFQQEYMAEFLDDAGGVFRGVADAVDTGRSQNEPKAAGRSYSMGVDLARVQDFTVITVVDDLGRQVYFERFNKISWERQIAAVTSAANAYNATIFIDSTGVGDPIFERLRQAQLKITGYQFTNASKEALIDNLAMKIERGDARFMDIAEQTNELLAFTYEMTPSRNVRMNAPEGMHDDCVISLALAYWKPKPKVWEFL